MTSMRIRAAVAAAVATAALAVPVAAAGPAAAVTPCSTYYHDYQQWNARAQALYAEYRHNHSAATLRAAQQAGSRADEYLYLYNHC